MAEILRWNGDRLLQRVTQIAQDYGDDIWPQLQAEIDAPVYTWPNKTRRKNGRTVTSPRDIVDLGNLKKSQSAPEVVGTAGGVSMEIRWDAPYSERVRRGGDYGEYVNARGKTVNVGEKPARDWVTRAVRAKPALPFFVRRWRELQQR